MNVFGQAARATYLDPELWLRLEPELLRHIEEAETAITNARLPDYESYCEKIGYLRGLLWVWKTAQGKTRVERHNNEDDR